LRGGGFGGVLPLALCAVADESVLEQFSPAGEEREQIRRLKVPCATE